MIWCCILISLVLPVTQAAEQILYAGDAYSILFTEQRDSQNLANGISASIDGKALTTNPSNGKQLDCSLVWNLLLYVSYYPNMACIYPHIDQSLGWAMWCCYDCCAFFENFGSV